MIKLLKKQEHLFKLGDKIDVPEPNFLLRYGLPFLISFLLIWLKYLIRLDQPYPYLLMLFSVVASGLYGGLGPGLLATVITILLVDYYFLLPFYTIGLDRLTYFPSLAYMTEGIAISFLIARQKKFQEEAYRKGEWFQVTLSSIGDAVITTDILGKITYMNSVAEKLTQWNFSEAKSRKAEEVFHIENEINKKPVQNPVTRVLRRKMIQGLDDHTLLITRQGKEIPVDDSAAPIRDSGGKLIGAVLVFRDIALRRELEKRKDDFISIASHELKTPITSIKAFNQFLIKKFKKMANPQALHILSRMEDQVDKLSELVRDLLDVSRIQSGRIMIRKEKMNIRKAIEEAVSDLKLTGNVNHKIVLDQLVDIEIVADPYRIDQVIINILTNAVKYSPEAKKIIIKAKSGPKFVTVSVQDFGTGIAKTDQKLIFEKFYRINPSKDGSGRFGSLGLGLFIVKEIIVQHKGKIWVESEPGKGSTFYFTLPVK